MANRSARIRAIKQGLRKFQFKEIKGDVGYSSTLEIENLRNLSAFIQRLPQQAKEAVKAKYRETLQLVSDDLYIALGEAMESKVWDWGYGDGDIVDTGALRDSLKLTVTNNSIVIDYNEDHAAIVYYGGYIHPYGNPNVRIYMPGRPWVDSVLTGNGPVEKFPFQATFKKYFDVLVQPELDRIK